MACSNVLRSVLLCCLFAIAGTASGRGTVYPFESPDTEATLTPLDRMVRARLEAAGISPAPRCSDEVFVRRAWLDITGTLPGPQDAGSFLDDESADKRARLIDRLLASDAFTDYWTLKWCDLLRVKAEFPINLWPNAVQAYHRWVYDALRKNMPMDAFARALLTSSGSNFREGPVNFCRAIQGKDPSAIARAAALTFMGARIETWTAADRENLEAFFSRVTFKPTAEWKEEIVMNDPAATEPLETAFPGGAPVSIAPGQDPRQVFADWLIDEENPWFARNLANRAWAWLMGRGIIHEPDDIRPDNPPANPELLAFLEKELVTSGYDLRHLFRVILNSAAWQQSPVPHAENPEGEALFAYYPVRRLEAEVLIDALCAICGPPESYASMIPEPFTYIPEYQRTIALADGSITSSFLETFGRPARDTGLYSERDNGTTRAQRLHLLNSSHIQGKIESSGRFNWIMKLAERDPARAIRRLYLIILSRRPTQAESDAIIQYAGETGLPARKAVHDLVWALINSKEFLYRH
jgi:hypothetical protein